MWYHVGLTSTQVNRWKGEIKPRLSKQKYYKPSPIKSGVSLSQRFLKMSVLWEVSVHDFLVFVLTELKISCSCSRFRLMIGLSWADLSNIYIIISLLSSVFHPQSKQWWRYNSTYNEFKVEFKFLLVFTLHLLVIGWKHRRGVIRNVFRMPDHRWMRLEWGSHYPWGGLETPSGPSSADLQTSLVSSEFSVIGICNWYQIETEKYQDNTQRKNYYWGGRRIEKSWLTLWPVIRA